jgi:hypothetical protein
MALSDAREVGCPKGDVIVSYSLVTEPWIPVLKNDGTSPRVGILEALANARSIRQIAASNPMDKVALMRFLLAVLHWCKPGQTEAEAKQLAGERGIPEEWLGKLGTLASPEPAFDLLGPGDRFYQDKSLSKQPGPIGELLTEIPVRTNIAHFRHVRDEAYGLCPACCALGIVRVCTFATAGLGGRTAAVNGPMAAYALRQGATLLDTVRLHWPSVIAARREPPWSDPSTPTEKQLDVPTVFAWRSRSIRLEDPADAGICAYCGEQCPLIQRLQITGGWRPPFMARGGEKKFWHDDPHLILVADTAADDDGAVVDSEPLASPSTMDSTRKTTLAFPAPKWRVATHAAFWRRAAAATVPRDLSEDAQARRVVVAGPAGNQALYQDACLVEIASAPDPSLLAVQADALRRLRGVLKQTAPHPDRKHPERAAAWDAMAPQLETDLHRDVERPPPGSHGEALLVRLAPVVDRIVRSTTPGSPLRRLEALRRARTSLRAAVDAAVARKGGAEPAVAGGARPQPPPARKPRRSRPKKGAVS